MLSLQIQRQRRVLHQLSSGSALWSIHAKVGNVERGRIFHHTLAKVLNLNRLNHVEMIIVRKNIQQPRGRTNVAHGSNLHVSGIVQIIRPNNAFLTKNINEILLPICRRNAFLSNCCQRTLKKRKDKSIDQSKTIK